MKYIYKNKKSGLYFSYINRIPEATGNINDAYIFPEYDEFDSKNWFIIPYNQEFRKIKLQKIENNI